MICQRGRWDLKQLNLMVRRAVDLNAHGMWESITLCQLTKELNLIVFILMVLILAGLPSDYHRLNRIGVQSCQDQSIKMETTSTWMAILSIWYLLWINWNKVWVHPPRYLLCLQRLHIHNLLCPPFILWLWFWTWLLIIRMQPCIAHSRQGPAHRAAEVV